MHQLGATLAHLEVRREHTVHRALGAEVTTFVEQDRIDLSDREVSEPLLVKHVEGFLALPSLREQGADAMGRRSGAIALPVVQERARRGPTAEIVTADFHFERDTPLERLARISTQRLVGTFVASRLEAHDESKGRYYRG